MMKCKICSHIERTEIDRAIVGQQQTIRDIAAKYEISRSAVDRHRRHIPKALTKAKQAETVAETTSLLSRVEKLAARCESIIDKAETAGKWNGAAAAARELRGCLELLAKLNGELQPNGARVAINFGDITKIDIRALSSEQLEALYDKVEIESLREVHSMTDAEMRAQLVDLGLEPTQLPVAHEVILFDEVTVPPGPGYETNKRAYPERPWRNASIEDRYRMLSAAWKRETGVDLTERRGDLGARAVMEIEVDLADDRDWMAWPKVRLRHVPKLPPVIPHENPRLIEAP